MINYLKKNWENHPLYVIVVAASFFRLLAVLFSKGYGMHDDHFLIIEAAQSWVDNYDYNHWLPKGNTPAANPSGHSLFYTGLHYVFFKGLEFLHIIDPQLKMYFVRLVHAVFSMIVVVLGFTIAAHYAGKVVAKRVGIMLALLWFMPMLSVRNLIEVVCVPFLLTATWLLIKNEKAPKAALFFWAGLIAGTAFSIRFQSALFIGGIGLVLLLQMKWKGAVLYGIGAALSICSIQGITDMFIWHRPFAEFSEYVRYNIENANAYNTQAWYNYLLLLSGILIPPISLFLLFGFFKSWRKYLLLFLPSFIFLAFHSYFPNKQERFIFPIVPFLIILGNIGWSEWIQTSKFWLARPKLLRGCWVFFWVINFIPLLFVTVAYSKRNRVEAMTYLSHKKDVRNLVMEDSNRSDFIMPPLFYLRKFNSDSWGVFGVTNEHGVKELYESQKNMKFSETANYVIFFQEENLARRIADFKKYYPDLKYETAVEPGFIDNVMHFLNPRNKNQVCFIFKMRD
jgi:Alg9-like mannosyltransferase family